MVAVLTVFANHLWGWPQGGFVGVDVFFVISGYLITGNLLRDAAATGTVSFSRFYWNRVRRIIPAATVVLILTYLAAMMVFQPFRTQQVGLDAIFAFMFLANWHFAIQGTDYFAATANSVSPIQHYWSLSIEEQFYFVWPALIFLVSLLVLRKGWTHERRMLLAGGVMGVVVASSLGWAIYQTTTSAAWAYFDTLSRVWELGVGALLATAVGTLARIPKIAKPFISWFGLALIAASLILISEHSVGFPAPWALLPVAGAALVIAAGVDGVPRFQALLCNPASGYIGDISYSLYLVHWPVIVILGALMHEGRMFYIAALSLAFAFAIVSYHFVENPLRRLDLRKLREIAHAVRRRRYRPEQSNGYAAISALALIVVAAVAYTGARSESVEHAQPPLDVAAAERPVPTEAQDRFGPLTGALQRDIVTALQAVDWPPLDPSMESVITGPQVDPVLADCGHGVAPDASKCRWGSPTAPIRIVLVGDSVALGYAEPLRAIALNSGGQIQVHSEAMVACAFVDDLVERESRSPECPARKQHAIDLIKATKPDLVVISNTYGPNQIVGSSRAMTPQEWFNSMREIVGKFSNSTDMVALLSPPPADKSMSDCYGLRSSTPADCISRVTEQWMSTAKAEQDLAPAIHGVWIDSRSWFCSDSGFCPSFVGSTPTKHDEAHMSTVYGRKISSAMGESLRQAGAL